MAIGRVNTGGGGSGGTLTVTGIAGHTVTATKDGKTYTRTFNSSGVAVFKGLSTGTWTLTMTGDGQTATRTVDVNADYSVTITYFSATINVTYPSGSTCKATHTDGTVLNAPDTSGTWACVVPKSGTWTVLAEDTSSGKSKSVNVSITADGQSESVTLTYIYYLQQGATIVVQPETTGVTTEIIDDTVKYKGTATEEIKIVDFGIVNLTGFSKITVDVLDGLTYHNPRPGICISTQKLSGYPSDNVTRFEGAPQGSTAIRLSAQEYYLDLSSISGEYYVSMFWKGFGNKNAYIQTSNIWIE